VATLAFAAMVFLFGWTIWQRYVAGLPSRWSDELCALIFLWVVFGASALVLPYREHIAVGLVYDSVSPATRRWMEAAGTGIAGAILLVALPVTVDYIGFLWRERTPALMWPLNRAYAVFALFQGMMGLRLILRSLAAIVNRPLPA
jgi:TRAP-type C4-dicarboxylate transport system permease small subunit